MITGSDNLDGSDLSQIILVSIDILFQQGYITSQCSPLKKD